MVPQKRTPVQALGAVVAGLRQVSARTNGVDAKVWCGSRASDRRCRRNRQVDVPTGRNTARLAGDLHVTPCCRTRPAATSSISAKQ